EIQVLIESGYRVRLLCWDRDARLPSHETRGGLTINRFRIRSTHGRGISQAAYLGGFWAAAATRALSTPIQAVHAHDFDTWPLGRLVARLRRVPLVLDAH